MIKCTDADKKELLNVLKSSAGENCFLYGDIENFSLDSDFMDVWKIVKNERTTSILLRYYSNYVVYSTNNTDYEKISEIINRDNEAKIINGLETTINGLSKFIDFAKIKNMYLAELNKKTYIDIKPQIIPQKAEEKDLDALFEFQCNVDEFNLTESSRKSFGQEVISGTGRIYFIEEEGKVISNAGLAAENSLNGMIIGVATDPKHRRRGLAKTCVSSLCREMVAEDKSVLLFYDNPDAGKLYKSLGFVDINRWSMGIK